MMKRVQMLSLNVIVQGTVNERWMEINGKIFPIRFCSKNTVRAKKFKRKQKTKNKTATKGMSMSRLFATIQTRDVDDKNKQNKTLENHWWHHAKYLMTVGALHSTDTLEPSEVRFHFFEFLKYISNHSTSFI